jgi:hypothetical protein
MSVYKMLIVALLAGCAPGYSVDVLSAPPQTLTLEYTHTVGSEYGAALRRADAVCGQQGLRARLASGPVAVSLDRSILTFDCVRGS